MDVMFTHGVGLDVQKKTVMACRVTPDPTGQQADGIREVKACGTLTLDWLALSDWWAEAGITQVAMESTGEYGTPGYHILEGDVTVFLVNAAQVQQVPGRTTDKAEARWLATRMRYGVRHARVIPPAGQRERRDLTRDRTKLGQERRREVKRVQGVLERATSTLASVATDAMGARDGRSWRPWWRGGRTPPRWRSWPKGACAARSPCGSKR